ncbi:1416_t:CDS:2, partial [Scutellospora calospora]
CIRAWYSIPSETITNCFHHTGLFDYEITTSTHEVHPNDEDLSVLTELEESLKMLSPHHSMSLTHYTNLPKEIDLIHQEFTDTDLLASTTSETDDDANSINDNNFSFTILSNSVKLDAIHTLQVFSSKVQVILDSFIQVGYQ